MKPLLALILLATVLLHARAQEWMYDLNTSDPESYIEAEKLLFPSVLEVPQRVYVGQIFAVTYKLLSVRKDSDILVEARDREGIRLIETPERLIPVTSQSFKIYYQITQPRVRLPDLDFSYVDDEQYVRRLKGETFRAIPLKPPVNFCKVLAKKMEIVNYQASSYTDGTNILALELNATEGNLFDFRLNGSSNQGQDRYEGDMNRSLLVYYAIFPESVERVTFTYFNLNDHRFNKFTLPILVKSNHVSTQVNLDPKANEFTKFKIALALVLILFWLILFWRKRRWIYLLLAVAAGAYVLTYLIPLRSVCIKPQSSLYLLPIEKSSVFLRTYEETEVKKMGERGDFIKIVLPNKQIGWVRKNDVCSP